ncbi:MAG: hypothetical protein AB2A00_04615 [Myxococcota bacterium]
MRRSRFHVEFRGCSWLAVMVLTACIQQGRNGEPVIAPPPPPDRIYLGPPGSVPTHVTVRVERGTMVGEAWTLHSVVDSNGKHSEATLPEDREPNEPIQFPAIYTVVGEDLRGETRILVEAFSREGKVLGRGSTVTQVTPGRGGPADLTLAQACTVNADCDDGRFCTGEETCVAGLCQSAPPPCPASGFTCITTGCDEVEERCLVDVRHDLCTPLATDAGTLERYCDPSAGCAVGRGCEQESECQDGSLCNGTELCVGYRCVQGPALDLEDDNPCTIDACVEEQGERHFPEADGTACEAPGISNGVCQAGSCVSSS